VHAVCLDLTDVLGYSSPAQLQPLGAPPARCWCRYDRALMDSYGTTALPLGGGYRDTRNHTEYAHAVGVRRRAYDPARGAESRFALHPRASSRRRRATAGERRARGLRARTPSCWGTSGTRGSTGWRRRSRRATRGVELLPLDAALARVDAVPAPGELPDTSWGEPRDLATWSAPPAAELAWQGREAELRVLATGAHPAPRALRELMALPGLDWAFRRDSQDRGPTRGAGARPRGRLSRALADRPESVPACATLHLHSTCLTRELQG